MSKAKCIPCLGADIKEAIRQLNDRSLDDALDKVPDCPDAMEMQLCIIKKGTKRSEYQQFVSDCLKTKPIKGKPFGEASKYLKEWAAAWRQQKGGNTNDSAPH